MTMKNRFQMLFKRQKVNQKSKLVIYQTDWSRYFKGQEMI